MEGVEEGIDPDIPPEEAARSKIAARYTTSPALRNWPRKKDWTWTPPHAQRCANEACRLEELNDLPPHRCRLLIRSMDILQSVAGWLTRWVTSPVAKGSTSGRDRGRKKRTELLLLWKLTDNAKKK